LIPDIAMSDIRNLDLNLLKAFDALMITRSVTRAAQRMGLSQPAVSGMLTRLREAFGDPLFIRTQRGILPTPRAEALAGPVHQALADIQAMLAPALFDPAWAEMTVSIAATDYAQKAVLRPFLSALRQEAPAIRVGVRQVDVSLLGQQMESGLLDMALITPDMAQETMRMRSLFDESYVCILREGHPVGQAPLDLDIFCALDHALMSHDGSQFRGATDVALAQLGRQRRVVAVVPSFLVLIDLVRHSDLIALVPSRLLSGIAGIITQPSPLTVPGFSKVLAWHERLQADPAHIWLRETLTRCAQR